MRPFYAAVFPKKSHVPSWNWKGNLTPFMKPQKLPEISVPTWEECWVSRHSSRRALFLPPELEMTVDYSASSVKESQCCRRPSRGGWSHLETRMHSQESCLNSKRPRFPHLLQIRLIPLHWLDCNPEDGLKTQREVWQHQGTSRKSPWSLCQLNGKPDTPFTPREGSGVPCLHTRRGLIPILKLHKNPEIHVRTGEEHWGSSLNSRWGPVLLHRLEMNPKRPLETRLETWLSWGNTSRSLRSPSQLERNTKFPAATRENPGDSPLNTRSGPFPLQHLERNPTQLKKRPDYSQHEQFPEVPVTTREKPQASHPNSWKTTRFPRHREMRPFFTCRA